MTSEHERSGALEAVDRILNRGGDADEVLRQVVGVLSPHYGYVAIDFVERDGLQTGPELGVRGSAVERIPIGYEGTHVGDLVVDAPADADRPFLQRVATLISAHVLLGWDTGGEGWEP